MEDISTMPVTALHGVGRVRAAAYARLGVHTVSSLLYHFPRAYENRGDIKKLCDAPGEGKCALLLTIGTEPKCTTIRRGMELLRFRAFDESGTASVTYFNQNYLRDSFVLGNTYRFYGHVERTGKQFTLSSPVAEPWDEARPLPGLCPVYPLTDGLSQKQIAQNIAEALALARTGTGDILPDDIRHDYRLSTLYFALSQIHAPGSFEDLAIAKRRLIFDEFFAFALGTAVAARTTRAATAIPIKDTELAPFLATLPYTLTDAQKKALDEVVADMRQSVPMRRIVVGDVGCGKTVIAAAAMYLCVKNGRQAALMAPTEILARQHAETLMGQFAALGMRVALLIGAMTKTQKAAVLRGLTTADPAERIDIVIGTHALLSEGVAFAAPGLVVADEQHRFGAGQRAVLSGKCDGAHMLVMSATPIPRSMALMLYGELSVSRITGMPPGRQKVDTFAVGESYRTRLDAFIVKNVAEGGQVYVVCPAIDNQTDESGDDGLMPDDMPGEISFGAALHGAFEPSDGENGNKPPMKAAIPFAEELKARLPSLAERIGVLHGRMKSAEKDAVMHDFATGRLAVLVSTTVIEVGVNVPNASLMIIESAERFGLSQLHQLRGRVGRGSRKSYCVLVSDARGENARARLRVMTSTSDGFAIAEEDLKQRGPGDFFKGSTKEGIRQSGGIRFRLADMCDDLDLLTDATAAAQKVLAKDPTLTAFPALRRSVAEMFEVESGTLS